MWCGGQNENEKIEQRFELGIPALSVLSDDLTKVQYEEALEECDNVISEMFTDFGKTEENCLAILHEAMKMIENREYQLKLNV